MLTAYELLPIWKMVIPHLEKYAIDKEGILRISGSIEQVNKLKHSLLRGESIDLNLFTPHIIAGVIKALLRELSEPLFPHRFYYEMLALTEIEDQEVKFELFRAFVIAFPEINKKLLRMLMSFLDKVVEKKEITKMDPQNLATVLGPTLLRPKDETPEEMLRNASKVVQIIEEFINQHSNYLSTEISRNQRSNPITLTVHQRELIETQMLELSNELATITDKTILVCEALGENNEMNSIAGDVKVLERIIIQVEEELKKKQTSLEKIKEQIDMLLDISDAQEENSKEITEQYIPNNGEISSVNSNSLNEVIESTEKSIKNLNLVNDYFADLSMLFQTQRDLLILHQEHEEWARLYQKKKEQLIKSDFIQQQAELLSVLYHWMVVAIRLELASRGHVHSFDKESLFNHLIQHRIPFQSWPLLIGKEASKVP